MSDEEKREEMVDNDEISAEEEGFLEGYEKEEEKQSSKDEEEFE